MQEMNKTAYSILCEWIPVCEGLPTQESYYYYAGCKKTRQYLVATTNKIYTAIFLKSEFRHLQTGFLIPGVRFYVCLDDLSVPEKLIK